MTFDPDGDVFGGGAQCCAVQTAQYKLRNIALAMASPRGSGCGFILMENGSHGCDYG